MYTHTKLKHSDGNDGKPVLPVFSGRGRGRPRKNTKRVDPTTEEYFKSEGREGGPSNPIQPFKEVLDEFKYDNFLDQEVNFPLYKYLERFAQCGGFITDLTPDVHDKQGVKLKEPENKPAGEDGSPEETKGNGVVDFQPQIIEQSKNALDEPLFIDPSSKAYLSREPHNLTEDEKSAASCDEVFAIYLYEISRKTNPDYYKIMLRFIIAYRECLNRYGWEKKAENDEVLNNTGNGDDMETTMITPASESIQEKAKELRKKAGGLEFSVINNAEHAPEICNEFVTVFLQDKKDSNLQKNESIDLTRNICHWLFSEGFTCSKVSMIKC